MVLIVRLYFADFGLIFRLTTGFTQRFFFVCRQVRHGQTARYQSRGLSLTNSADTFVLMLGSASPWLNLLPSPRWAQADGGLPTLQPLHYAGVDSPAVAMASRLLRAFFIIFYFVVSELAAPKSWAIRQALLSLWTARCLFLLGRMPGGSAVTFAAAYVSPSEPGPSP
jgi:hypothetical protein